jgi:phage FluMu gp28-like protein
MTSTPIAPQIRQSPTLFSTFVLGVEPHQTQARFLECRSQTKTASCGRRWGKSTAAALDAIHLAVVGDGEGKPTVQMICAPTADQTTIIAGEIERLLLGGPLAPLVADVVHSPFMEVALKNGSTIMARSTGDTGRNLRGRAAHRVIVDEAAFVPQDVITEVIAPMLADHHGQLVLISTPFGKNGFWEYFVRGQGTDPSCTSFQFPSELNPYISREYIEAQRDVMTSMQFQSEWQAQFVDTLGTVFSSELIARATRGELAAPVRGHQYSVGWDPAKWVDRSAVIILDVTERPWHVVGCETLEGRDYTRQLARVVRLTRDYNNAFCVLDATGNEALLEQLVACDVACEGVRFTNPAKQSLIDGLVLALEQGNVTFPHLPALMQELRYYSYALTTAGNVKLGAPDRAGAHDDLVTALALATKSMMDVPEQREVISLTEILDETMPQAEWEALAGALGGHIDSRY